MVALGMSVTHALLLNARAQTCCLLIPAAHSTVVSV